MTETIEQPGTSSEQPGTSSDQPLDKVYRPAEVERAVYQRWLDADVFAPEGTGSRADWSKPPFVIVQPPPNVTGALHLGHALITTIEDTMIRRARMQGRPTLWVPGVDHASIAAHVVLDRIIATEGQTRQSLGRDGYLARMWCFMEETRGVIGGQHRRLGASADWSRERFTMDPVSARAVRTAFKKLYDDGLAYRGEKLIHWCPGDLTSLSDLEVEATPETGTLWFVRYHLLRDDGTPDPDATVTVATTRPETILGDTGVAVHPDDQRYRALVGRQVLIPFVDRPVPIFADAVVDPAFGSGAVKITPAHDHDDFETGKRHGLEAIDVMTDDARINERGGPYAGLSREEARLRIVADLEARGDLVEARPHEMILGRCQRSKDVVEPRLKVQWFIDVKPMAERAMAAVREGRTRFVPARFEKVFFDWMENIRDWNVSRQLWWGHRIPAWYCPDGHITVSDRQDGPERCDVCGRPAAELQQDDDIFDTWFSSGLWPFSTLGWPEQTADLQRFYPTSVLETGYDIIFFWVARMMMLGEWLTRREPFRVVYLNGMVRDPYGAKMSKTLGNVVDPLDTIDDIGADALRFALIHGGTPGNDQKLGPSRLDGSRNFANKIWNAARFVLGARPPELADGATLTLPPASALGPAEHWILWRCSSTIAAVEAAFAAYQFGEATRLLHDAIWNEYCDWYLELAKVQLTPEADPARRAATWQVLSWVLDRYLRLLHPVMPHLTEEIWGRLPHEPGDPTLLIVASWPAPADTAAAADAAGGGVATGSAASVADGAVAAPSGVTIEFPADETQARGVEVILELIRGIRNARAESGLEAVTMLDADILLTDPAAAAVFPAIANAVQRLARVRASVHPDRAVFEARAEDTSLAVLTSGAEARLARGGADLERERARLQKELDDARAVLGATEAKLANASFVERAPPAVVEAARARAVELRERVDRLSERLAG